MQPTYVLGTFSLISAVATACAVSSPEVTPTEDAATSIAADATSDASHTSAQTVCGARTSFYNAGFNRAIGPFSLPIVTRVRNATGVIHWNSDTPRSVTQRRVGSGFLVAPRVLATAMHNVDPNIVLSSPVSGINTANDVCSRIHVDFGFINANGSDPVPLVNGHEGASYACERVLSAGVGGYDVAILLLHGTPGSAYGYLPVATDAPSVGAPVLLMGTPAGLPLMASYGTLVSVDPGTLGYDADSVGGFSGGPVADLIGGRALGVHRAGSCDEDETNPTSANFATPMHAILDSDPALRALIAGERCDRRTIDCLCAAGSDSLAQARCFDASRSCSSCVSEAIAACCTAESDALQSCTRTAMCNDDACVSVRCGAQSTALNHCWSSAQEQHAACLGAFAMCFGMYPVLCS